jgi:hypothetical protein
VLKKTANSAAATKNINLDPETPATNFKTAAKPRTTADRKTKMYLLTRHTIRHSTFAGPYIFELIGEFAISKEKRDRM